MALNRRKIMVSRQRLWQHKQIAAGRCKLCSAPRKSFASFCDSCRSRVNASRRTRRTKKAN